MEFLFDYLAFLLKAATIAFVFVLVVSGILAAARKNRQGMQEGYMEVREMNACFAAHRDAIQQLALPRKVWKTYLKKNRKAASQRSKTERKRIFLVTFQGSLQLEGVGGLNHEINAILEAANSDDEVLVVIESPGGVVCDYGLVASQLQRVRDKAVQLTVAVDKMAASGGYLAACPAHKIIAAPFALVGSIGVVAELPNFHRLLQKHDIDFDVYKAGEFKRTVTIFGENSSAGKEKFLEELGRVHTHFQRMVREYRPNADWKRASTGEVWLASDALELGLVDELCTSDAYLLAASKDADIYQVRWIKRMPLSERVVLRASEGISRSIVRLYSWLTARIRG